jgi:hypothetical protein
MVFLRPKTDATPAPAPATPAGNVNTGAPAQTGFGKAVEAAKNAAGATNAASAKSDAGSLAAGSDSAGAQSTTGAATGTANGTKTPPATPASAKATGLPLPVLKAVAHHKVLALLFWNPKSPDDQLVHKALKKVDRFDGEVYVHAAPISQVARYARITRGADVEQASTVVVVDRKLRSTNLVGYVSTLAIEQAVVDALRASGGIFLHSPYLAKVNKACATVSHDFVALPQAQTGAQAPDAVRSRARRFDEFVSTLKSTSAPARLRGFRHSFIADAVTMQAGLHTALGSLGRHPSTAKSVSVQSRFTTQTRPASRHLNKLADRHHLVYCGRLG